MSLSKDKNGLVPTTKTTEYKDRDGRGDICPEHIPDRALTQGFQSCPSNTDSDDVGECDMS